MQERITPESYYNFQPSMAERARVFIGDKMSQNDRDTAANIAELFQDPNKPMADTAVLIPVAAHQDGRHIFNTMEQYANQRGCKPFTVFLHLNAPLDTAPLEDVEFAIAETERAKKAFPQLDIRHDIMYYGEEAIGGIRRNLWNAAFLLAHHEGKTDSDIIGMNHDIDTAYVSPHYVSRVQQYYDNKRQRAAQIGLQNFIARPTGTRVTHATLPGHPNVGKVTTWIDNSHFQDPKSFGYEAGLVIPFSYYSHQGGFRAHSKTHETSWVYDFQNIPYLTGAHLYTSPRRYIDRLDEFGNNKIWTHDSFTHTDACRGELRKDITSDRAEELIHDRLYDDIMRQWLPRAMRPIYSSMEEKSIIQTLDQSERSDMVKAATEAVSSQLAKAERLLRRVIRSDLLADMVAEGFNIEKYCTEQVESMSNWYAWENSLGDKKADILRLE